MINEIIELKTVEPEAVKLLNLLRKEINNYLPSVLFSYIYEYLGDICYTEEKLLKEIEYSEIEYFNKQQGFNIFDDELFFITFLNKQFNIHSYNILNKETKKYIIDTSPSGTKIYNIYKYNDIIYILLEFYKSNCYNEFLLKCNIKTLEHKYIVHTKDSRYDFLLLPHIKFVSEKYICIDNYVYNELRSTQLTFLKNPIYIINDYIHAHHKSIDVFECKCNELDEMDVCICHEDCYMLNSESIYINESSGEIGYLITFDNKSKIYMFKREEVGRIIKYKKVILLDKMHDEVIDFKFNNTEICVINKKHVKNNSKCLYLYIYDKEGHLCRKKLLDTYGEGNKDSTACTNYKYVIVNNIVNLQVYKRTY